MKKDLLHIFIFFLLSYSTQAQIRIGQINSNYAGVNGIEYNPSFGADSWSNLDINILGLQLFANNDYAYINGDKFNFIDFLSSSVDGNEVDVDFNTNQKHKDARLNLSIMGPSFVLSKGTHSFGLLTSFKNHLDVSDVPQPLLTYSRLDLQYLPQQQIEYDFRNMSVNAMSYAEIGFNYSNIFAQYGYNQWSGGVTVKQLIGLGAASFQFDRMNFVILDSSNLFMNNFDLDYAYTEPSFGSGTGMGLDLGVTYKFTREVSGLYTPHSRSSNCTPMPYKFKIGASIRDLGRITYRSTRSRLFEVDDFLWRQYDTLNLTDISSLENSFGQAMPFTDRDESSYKMSLPTTFNLSFDYAFLPNWFVSGNWTQRVNLKNGFGVRGANVAAIVPRYESRAFEMSIPVSYYDYRKFQVGAQIRVYNFIIGTENLLTYLSKNDVYGADLYLNMKVTIFDNKQCRAYAAKRANTCKSF